jgi:hypothetical protein
MNQDWIKFKIKLSEGREYKIGLLFSFIHLNQILKMPLAILWTNISEQKFTDSIRRRLVILLANCARKSPEGTGLIVHTDCKCSLGTALNEPALFLLVKL